MAGFLFLPCGLPRPALLATVSRAAVFAFGCLVIMIGQPYDTSQSIALAPLHAAQAGTFDPVILRFLGPFSNWDGVYFLNAADRGYEVEQFHAFYPLLPAAMSWCSSTLLWPLEAAGWTSRRTTLLIAGLAINLASFVLAAEILFILGCVVLLPGKRSTLKQTAASVSLPLLASYLFAITPGGVFMSALYTESVFAALSFAGMLCCVLAERTAESAMGLDTAASRLAELSSIFSIKRLSPYILVVCASIAFTAAATARSNGSLLAVFILVAGARIHRASVRTASLSCMTRASGTASLLFFAACAGLVLLPMLAFSWYAFFLYCAPAPAQPLGGDSIAGRPFFAHLAAWILRFFGVELPVTVVSAGLSDARPWCAGAIPTSWPSVLPGIYGFVQREYWGVGMLQYYLAKNIPQFFLAAPMVALACSCAAWYARVRPSVVSYTAAASIYRLQQLLVEGTTLALALFFPIMSSSAVLMLDGGGAASSVQCVVDPPSDTSYERSPIRRVTRSSTKVGSAFVRHLETTTSEGKNEAPSGALPEGRPVPALNVLHSPAATLPFVCHWLALVAIGLLVMHVQVITRFVCACPALYWYMAALWLGDQPQGDAHGRPVLWRLVPSALLSTRVLLLVYCVGYTLVGTLLFTNFYNWT